MKLIYTVSVVLLLSLQQLSAQTNFYSQTATNLQTAANWNTMPDGSGTAAADFTSNSQIFIIDEATASIGAAWVVSGTGSKIVVGDGVGATVFSTSTFTITGTIDVADLAIFRVQSATALYTLGTLATGSTVEYAMDATQQVALGTYDNLTLTNASGARTKTALGAINVNGALVVNTNNTFAMSTFALGGTILGGISGTGSLTSANVGTTPVPSGQTWTQTVTFNPTTGSVPGGTYQNLTISTTGVKTALGDITVSGTLNVSGTLAMSTFLLTVTTPTGAGTITTANTTATPIPSGLTWTQTIQYVGANAQTVVAGTYPNLQINGGGSAVKTAAANITVNGTLTVAATTFFDLGTFAVSAATYTNAGTIRTQNTGATPFTAGKSYGAVNYNSTSPQTVLHGTYAALNLTGGDRTLSTVGNINISSTFTTGSGVITTTGTTVVLTGTASTQTVTLNGQTTFEFHNLTIASTSANTKTFNSTGACILKVNAILDIQASRLLTLGANVQLDLGGGATFSGTGTLAVSCTLANPIPSGITWPFIVNYNSASNQSIVQGVYGRLLVSGNGNTTATGDITVNDSLGITSGALVMGTNLLQGAIAGAGGTGISGTGSITTANTTAAPIPLGRVWTQTVSYIAAANQTVADGSYANLTVSGGAGFIKTAAGNLTVTTTVTITATILDMSTFALTGTTITSTGTLRTQNTGVTPLPSNKTIAGTVEYNAAGMQNVIKGTYTNLNITGGDRTLVNDTIRVNGTFTSSSGAITATGNILMINGTTQSMVLGSTGSFNTLLISGGTKTVTTGTLTVDGTLDVASTRTLALGTNDLAGTLSVISGTGIITTSSLSMAPVPAGKSWTQTVTYAAATAQNVSGGTYENLTLSGGNKTATGNVTVTTALNTAAVTFDLATFQLLGIAGTLTATGTFATANTSSTPIPVRSWGTATVSYNSASPQTVVVGTYGGLNISGGDRTLPNGDTIKVSGTLTSTSGVITATGNILVLNGTTQNITLGSTGSFNQFLLTAGTTKTVTAGTLTIDGTLDVPTGRTLVMGTNQLAGNLTTISGTGTISTGHTGVAIPAGKTWTQTVNYLGVAQNISGGIYENLTLSGSGTKTATGDVTVNTVLNSGALTVDMGTNQLSGVATLTSSTGVLSTANTGATPIPVRTWTYATVNYNSASPQTVVNGQYVALNLTGGDRTLSNTDTIRVSGTLTMGANTITTGTSTVALNGTTQTVSLNAGGTTFHNLAIIAGTTKTISTGNLVVNGDLFIVAAGNLSMTTFQLDVSAATLSGTGIITTTNTGATPLSSGLTWPYTVVYTAATQNVMTGTYQNLTISTTGTKTALGNIVVNGTLNVSATLNMVTNILSGAFAPSSAGTVQTQNTGATPVPTGKTWTQTFLYNAAGSQNVMNGQYVALTLTGGNRVLDNTGTIKVSGAFTMGTGVITATGVDIEINGATTQTITLPAAGVSFNNFNLSTGTTKTIATGPVTLAGTLTIASGVTLAMGTNQLSGTFATAGTGTLTTANVAATPIPSNVTWPFTVAYSTTNTNQTVVPGLYNGGLTLSATSGTRTRTATGSITVGGTFTIGVNTSFIMAASSTLTLNCVLAQTGFITTGPTCNIIVGTNAADAGTLLLSQASVAARSLLSFTLNRATGADAITLGNEVIIISTGTVTITDGTLAANGNLVFQSTGVSTSAQLAPVTGTGNISGKIQSERFIDGRNINTNVRWRFLAAPVTTDNGIDDNWQQQIHITGTGTGGTACPTLTQHTNGFDATDHNTPSFYVWSSATQTWVSIANTNATELETGKGYRVYVRGARTQGCALLTGNPNPNDTTLSAAGTPAVGTQNLTCAVGAGGYEFIGNPFQATIDWDAPGLTKTNIAATIFGFRPDGTANGAYGTYNGGIGTNGMTRYIPVGSSVWVQTNGSGNGSISIPESAKEITQGGFGFFKTAPMTDVLRTKLYKDTISNYMDEVVIAIRDGALWNYDMSEDAVKFGFAPDQLALYTPSAPNKYAICRVPGFDTVNNRINIDAKTTIGSSYKLSFEGILSFDPSLGMVLTDTYTSTTRDLRSNAEYAFTTPDTASTASSRFYITFTTSSSSLPVKLVSFTGKRNDKDETELNWKTASEINSDKFEVERSTDDKKFETIGTVKASRFSRSTVSYSLIDATPVKAATNYYRLKQFDRDGSFTYSRTVAIEFGKGPESTITTADIKLYPVPVKDQLVVEVNSTKMLVNPALRMYDMFGKLLNPAMEMQNGRWVIQTDALQSGVYIIQLENNGTTTQMKVVKN
jgi:hypothetical protein